MRVAVLGGGIQGTCVALELASRGVTVDLIEAGPTVMSGASRHNEGKIHLGYVYANDPSLRTADLLMRGAQMFQPLMRRWLGTQFDAVPVSRPFDYAVHEESLLPPAELEDTYLEISRRLKGVIHDGTYLGIEDPFRLERFTSHEIGQHFGTAVTAGFSTQEIAVDPDFIADLLVRRVSGADGISLRLNTTVRSVDPLDRMVDTKTPGGETRRLGRYDHVVNATWAGRPAIDATVGLYPPRPWSFRMKYFARLGHVADHEELPSTTIVLGGFGDLVNYGSGELFVSWYPVARRGWDTHLDPPHWATCPPTEETEPIAQEMIDRVSQLVPALSSVHLSECGRVDVRGGVIYALGATDVDDPASELHERFDVGTTSRGWYHSIDTGKYTTAPLFAVQAADRVTGDRP